MTCNGTSLIANEANNYAFSSTLTLPSIAVAPNTELTFDWGGVTASLIDHPIDAKKDLNSISILMWDLSLADLQTKLNADSLGQRDLTVVPLTITTDGSATSAKLFTFTLNGGAVDSATILGYFDATHYPPENHTYTMMAATGTVTGQGVKMIQSFQLDPNSTNTMVTMTSNSTLLDFTADLSHLTPTGVPAGEPAITLNWSQMTKNALGNDFILTNITSAFVGHYTQSLSDLQGNDFLDLDLIATELYQGGIDTGTVADFSTLQDDSGKSFPGIDSTGTWLVGLQCGACHNPAPWYLTVLKVCTP